jgi:hypothetical protein
MSVVPLELRRGDHPDRRVSSLAVVEDLDELEGLLAASTGSRTPLHFDDALLELINDASLRQWAVIPPRTAVQDCLAAAAEIDALIGSLEADVVLEVVQTRRERLVDRSLHRGEHLNTIETAFPAP